MRRAGLPLAVALLFAARFCIGAVRAPPPDGDLAWQRWLGEQILRTGRVPTSLGTETFTATGSPWLAQEWLFGIVAASAHRVGLDAVFAVAIALCAVLALVLLVRRAAAGGASTFATALAVFFTGFAMVDSFGVRVQVIDWPLLVAFGSLLEREAPWLICAAVACVWANVHAGAVLAPVLATAWAAGLAIRDRALSRPVARAVLTALATAAAVAVNPFGFALIAYATALMHNPIKDFVREWQPVGLGDASFTWGALPLIAGVVAWALADGRRAPQRVCAIGVGVLLLCSAARNIPIFALIAAPYAALGFTRVLDRLAPHLGRRHTLAAAATAALVVLAALTGVRVWRSGGTVNGTTGLIAALAAAPGEHRLLCQDYAWCGPALGRGRIRVFLDGRADPYPFPVWAAAFRVAHRNAGWSEALDAYGVDTVLARRDTLLGEALRAAPGWRRAGDAGAFSIFVRSNDKKSPRGSKALGAFEKTLPVTLPSGA